MNRSRSSASLAALCAGKVASLNRGRTFISVPRAIHTSARTVWLLRRLYTSLSPTYTIYFHEKKETVQKKMEKCGLRIVKRRLESELVVHSFKKSGEYLVRRKYVDHPT